MTPDEEFHLELGRTIQAWLLIETEAYVLYSVLMRGANPHLVSITFHHIQSFEAKLGLLDNCLALVLGKESEDWKTWRSMFNRLSKLNEQRNKIVHQPVITERQSGKTRISISPSYFNALTLTKGQTTHTGPVTAAYNPSGAKLLEAHRIDLAALGKLGATFRTASHEIHAFKDSVSALMKSAK